MANRLTFLKPLRYDAMGTMLLIQAGPLARALPVAATLRTLFPGCRLEGLARDATAIALLLVSTTRSGWRRHRGTPRAHDVVAGS